MFGSNKSGMAMMLQQMLGVDPAELIANFDQVAFNLAVSKVQLDRIEAKLDATLSPEMAAEINARFPTPVRKTDAHSQELTSNG